MKDQGLMSRYLYITFSPVLFTKFLLLILSSIASLFAFAQPRANFTASPLSGCAPIVVNFTDQSTGAPDTWRWDLGNGVTSTQQNPSTTYFSPGLYTIKLVVLNALGKDSLVKTNYITIYTPPQVSFSTVSSLTGCFPLRVQFTDNSTSTSPITGWQWDFGDGTTSALQNPIKIYTSAGNFNVALKVTNSNGCSSLLVKPGFVKPTAGVTADFSSSNPVNCKPPEAITFTNLSSGPGTLSYQWNFGDGGISTQANPIHTYTTAGLFNVQLIVNSDQGCVDTITKNNALSVGIYQSGFSKKDSICLGDTLSIQNTSLPNPPNSTWYFGDGTTSANKNPVKIYTAAGTYTIKLVNNYGACLDSSIKQVAVISNPVPAFSAPQTSSCSAPFTVNFQDATPGAAQWLWDFGDGVTSTQQNPLHTYTTFGQFTVTLTVTNSIGCKGTTTKANYIQIAKPFIQVSGLPANGCIPFTINPVPTVSTPGTVSSWLWNFGDGTVSNAQNPSHTYNVTGTYTVKLFITTSGGCADSLVINNAVRTGNKPTPGFTASPLSICAGKPVQFTDASTGSPDQWLWNFGDNTSSTQQNPSHSFDTSGTFTIGLTVFNNGCADSVKKINYITVLPPVPRFTVNYDCAAGTNITFTDNSIGATTWAWDFGDGGTSALQNPAHTFALGTYNVKLTVTNGACSNSLTKTIKAIKESVNLTYDQAAKCKNIPFAFNAVISNPANITAYNWSFSDGSAAGGTGVNHAFNNTGTQWVKLAVTDINGCKDSTAKIPIQSYGPKAAYSFTPPTQCTNQDVTFNNTSTTDGTNAITSALWSFGDGNTVSNINPTVLYKYTQAGSYNTKLKVTDTFGCSDSLSLPAVVTILKSSISFTAIDTLTCPGGSIQFNNTSAGSNLTYNWNFGDGTTSAATNPLHTYTTTGKYKVTLTGTESIGCIDSMVKVNYITVDLPKAAFAVSDSFTICPPLQVQFTNNSTFYKSVLWKFGDGNTSTVINPKYSYSIPNVYTVTLYVTSPGGCVDSVKKIITVLSNTKGVLTYSPLSGCYPQTIDFKISSTNPVKYFWDYGDGSTFFTTDSIQHYQYGYPGYYLPKVTMQDAQGCLTPVFGPDTIKIFGAKADFSFDKTLLCDAGNVQFRDSSFTADAVSNYTWDFGDGTAVSALKNPLHFYSNPGIYKVTLTIRTANGCTNTMTKPALIKVVKSPQISITGNTVYCNPATVQLNGINQPDTSAVYWKWVINNNTIINQQNTGTLNFPAAGSYPVLLTVVNSSGCVDTATTTITVNQTPTVNAGKDTIICLGSSITLQPAGAAVYTWSPATYLTCTNCNNPVSTPKGNITYYVTGTTPQACSAVDSITIKVQKPFTITASGDTNICAGQSVQLLASGADKYIWSPGSGLNNPAISNPIAGPSATTNYMVVGYDNNGCFTDTAYVAVNVYNYPTVNLGRDTTIMGGSSIELKPISSNDVVSWQWTAEPAGTLSCYTCPITTAKPIVNSIYTVEVKNSIGCATTGAIKVIVLCQGGKIYLPNSFTPNGDGINDWFYVMGNGVQTIKVFQIFDRWGKIIFNKRNIAANSRLDGWNGQFNGVDLPTGVYPYIIEVICGDGALFKLNGSVTLIR
ncbi:MAG: PKD domain-containing protein [Sphingobacteriales bacterium]|nr:MAG: PKD domain-containing protein [Sphingobacteriales bacterium]